MRGVSCDMSTSCVEGVRPLGGYEPNMIVEPASPASAWQYQPNIPKREPGEQEEHNHDSGIASGSDIVSLSPDSQHSDTTHPTFSSPTSSKFHQSASYSSTPVMRPPLEQSVSPQGLYESPHTLAPKILPPMAFSSPEKRYNSNMVSENPLRRLEMSLEKNGFLPTSVSPKMSEGSAEDDNKSDNDIDEYNQQGLRVPKVNSHGKVKTHKCKQCNFIAYTKLDFWEHLKTHIKTEKLLTCHKCPFVTEYKHHLEYHLRNHAGSKPFECIKCEYTCVNKSMLNSHLKSHSKIYQYRCADCVYATKYCHSLKLHLRKYKHNPAMVLNPDGSPNPLPIIDVYGTRRGPKLKVQEQKQFAEENVLKNETTNDSVLQFPLHPFIFNAQQLPLPFTGFPFFNPFQGSIPTPLLIESFKKLALESQMSQGVQNQSPMEESSVEESPVEESQEEGVLDLRKSIQPSISTVTSHQNDSVSEDDEEEEAEGTTTMFENVEAVQEQPQDNVVVEHKVADNTKGNLLCQYCEITFGDEVLHTMHMGYHGYKDPFACNMCGVKCNDKVSFFVHIARTPHS